MLAKTEPHKLTVGISERGNVPIEYYLSEQWYIRMGHFARLALTATRTKKLKLIPEYQEKVWEHWLNNIQDWCISRQLWWGHRMPMYTCADCKFVMCEEKKPRTCEKCGHKHLVQDSDVLDTWASSWLWPLGVHNWAKPNRTEQKALEYYYPTDVLITGADIIFFWIARMVMVSEYLTSKPPFHTCYFTPIIRDSLGRKMSKSLGNSADVLEIMQAYGTDALRFSVASQIVQGQDIFWKDESCEIGKTFSNKIWNVARFLTMHAKEWDVKSSLNTFDKLQTAKSKPKDEIGKWIVSEFFATVQNAHNAIQNYEFAQYTSVLYEFTWKIFCDWFVELIKPRLADQTEPALAKSTLQYAFQIFDGMLRLLHPVMPFVTEKIWQSMYVTDNKKTKSQTIGHKKLPKVRNVLIDEHSIVVMHHIQHMVGAVRTIRGQFNIHPAQELTVYTSEHGKKFERFQKNLEILSKSNFHFQAEKQGFCATCIVDGAYVHVSLEGLVDKQAEKERLTNKIAKLLPIIAGLDKKLSNEQFINGAPAHIVEGARKQHQENSKELTELQNSLNTLELF